MMKFLAGAYAGLWIIHLLYLWSLGSRQKKVDEEIQLLTERAKRGGQ